jgi:uncharacterized protein (DUF111 family)
VRIQNVQRVVAEREIKSKTFLGYRVSEKWCGYKGRVFSKIENDDLVKISKKANIPVIELIERYKAGKSKKK